MHKKSSPSILCCCTNKKFSDNEFYSKTRTKDKKRPLSNIEQETLSWEKLKASLTKNIGPMWYQELSDRQLNAADGLFEGLRDDLEQGTEHRCRFLLKHIGLLPIPAKTVILSAIEMSRGNDLAFLWFLNEMFYSTDCHYEERTNYTLNERLILSSICHLDMITTLRELDKLVPAPMPCPKSKTLKCVNKCHCKTFSPYLERLPRPIIPISEQLPPPPIPGPNFEPYLDYKNCNYKVLNETTRWYAKADKADDLIDRKSMIDLVCDSLQPKFDEKKDNIFETFKCLTNCVGNGNTSANHDTIVYQVELDNANTTEEFEDLARRFHNQSIVRTIIRDLIDNAQSISRVRVCCNSNECVSDYMKYVHFLSRKQCMEEKRGRVITRYFQMPTYMSEYKFDYHKIFCDETFGELNEKTDGYFAKELNKTAGDTDIEVCMKNLWKLEIPLWNETNVETNIDSKTNKDNSKSPQPGDRIDPKDTENLRELLKVALNKMNKNPKFVLASIPGSYNVPILIEWMRVRYGYKYSKTERQKRLKISQTVWDIFRKHPIDVPIPARKEICAYSSVSYDEKHIIEERVRSALNDYYHRLSFAMIEHGRIAWPILEPYLCTKGPPREVFYAYLPSSIYDVTAFRPWQICD